MSLQVLSPIALKDMSDRLYEQFSQFVYLECGIQLPPIKKLMLQARLTKRLKALGLPSFEAYYQYLTTDRGRDEELIHALDVISTNKTEFFREPHHFDYLKTTAIPQLLGDPSLGKKIHLWSAGCSSGEEPYSLAMVMSESLALYPGLDFDILATDISQRMLNIAEKAVYPLEKTSIIPSPYRFKYVMNGKGSQKGNSRVIPELRTKIQFRRLNLMAAILIMKPLYFRNYNLFKYQYLKLGIQC